MLFSMTLFLCCRGFCSRFAFPVQESRQFGRRLFSVFRIYRGIPGVHRKGPVAGHLHGDHIFDPRLPHVGVVGVPEIIFALEAF